MRIYLLELVLNVNAFNCEDEDPIIHIEYKKRMLISAFGVDLVGQYVYRKTHTNPLQSHRDAMFIEILCPSPLEFRRNGMFILCLNYPHT